MIDALNTHNQNAHAVNSLISITLNPLLYTHNQN